MPGRRFSIGVIAASACVSACLVAVAAGASTPDNAVAYQIDAAHDGVQVDASLAPPFARRWNVTLPGQVSYPLIAQGLVYVTASDNNTGGAWLYALDQTTGAIVWSQALEVRWGWAAAAYDAGKIFVAANPPSCCDHGIMYAFDASTGAQLWVTPLPHQYVFSSPPTAGNGVVYTGGAGSGGTLYAVDETNGAMLATQSVENGDQSSPALSDTGVFVTYACNQDYGFAQTTLAPLWHYTTFCEGGGGATPAYANGRLYTRDYFDNLILDTATGNVLGRFAPSGSGVSPIAVDGNTLWAVINGSLTAEDVALPSTPQTLWTFAGDGQLYTAPIAVSTASGEFVVEGSASGMLYALNAANGAQVWSANVGTAIGGANQLAAGQGLLVVPAGKTVSAYVNDSTSPTLTVPSTITAQGRSANGAVVSFSASATDPDDPATVSCVPPSGSTFPVGTTTVQCTATDTVGNSASASFLVVVSAPGVDCNLADYPLVKNARNLKNANLSGCYLPGANLANANATNVNMNGTYLAGANLSGANLSQAHLVQATLINANLSGANLSGANLNGAKMSGAILTGAKWSQTTCPDGTSSNADGGTCIGHLG